MSFILPDNHKEYYKQVVKKSHQYIKIGFWSEIDTATLNRWLKNFSTDEEKYFSALLLDQIVYKNIPVIKSSLSKLFHITLPNILDKYNIYKEDISLIEWEDLLRKFPSNNSLPIRFTTITSEKELGDSGSDYMRRLRKYYLVNRKFLKRIDSNKEEGITTLIIIDDIIASGEQAKTFIDENITYINQYSYIIFMPLTAHIQGINAVKEKIEKLKHMEKIDSHVEILIEPIEIMDEQISFFPTSNLNKLIDTINSIEDIKEYYEKFIRQKLPTISDYFGNGDLSLLLLFSTGVPDNTLPIIHTTDETTGWQALYEKF